MHADDRDHPAPGMSEGARPRRRTDGLVVEDVGDETLVFDRDRDVAHCLGPEVAALWRACDGRHDLGGLAGVTRADQEAVAAALDELGEKGLLAGPARSGASAYSRRFALKRIGAAGIAASTIPLIVSATIGVPLAHASGGMDSLCSVCTIMMDGSDSCAAGYLCDPTGLVCLQQGCEYQMCDAGSTCDSGLGRGMCTAGCTTGSTMCC
jgi:hypothetical protein